MLGFDDANDIIHDSSPPRQPPKSKFPPPLRLLTYSLILSSHVWVAVAKTSKVKKKGKLAKSSKVVESEMGLPPVLYRTKHETIYQLSEMFLPQSPTLRAQMKHYNENIINEGQRKLFRT